MRYLIVSRHAAAIQFVRQHGGPWATATAIAEATPEDIAGAVVAGNLPLHLAAAADMVLAIEFAGRPPRGAEYRLEDMVEAGARLALYRVSRGGHSERIPQGCATPPQWEAGTLAGLPAVRRLAYAPTDCDGGAVDVDLVPPEVLDEIERWRGTSSRDDLDRAIVEVYSLPGAGLPGRSFCGATWSWTTSPPATVWHLVVAGESYTDRGIADGGDFATLDEARAALAAHEYQDCGVYWAYAERRLAGTQGGVIDDHPGRVWLVGGRA